MNVSADPLVKLLEFNTGFANRRVQKDMDLTVMPQHLSKQVNVWDFILLDEACTEALLILVEAEYSICGFHYREDTPTHTIASCC